MSQRSGTGAARGVKELQLAFFVGETKLVRLNVQQTIVANIAFENAVCLRNRFAGVNHHARVGFGEGQ